MDKDWATGTIKEVPFWKDGMTPEEYDEERKYFYNNYKAYQEGRYKPLWQQKTKSEI